MGESFVRGALSVEQVGEREGQSGTNVRAEAFLPRKEYARYLGGLGARIVSLSPGLIATPQGAREFEKSAGKMKLYERTPLGREGTMLEIADAIEFLASDRASFISGTDLLVDGGLAGTLASD